MYFYDNICNGVVLTTERKGHWLIGKDVTVDIIWDLDDELISDLRIKTGRCRDRKNSTAIYIGTAILKASEVVFR